MGRNIVPRGKEQYAREVASLTRLRGALLIDDRVPEELVHKVTGLIDRLVDEVRIIMNLPAE